MFLQKARRNPLFLIVAGVILVAAVAFAWWTISPLFVRTTLVEGDNINVPAVVADNSTAVPATATAIPTATTIAATSDDSMDDSAANSDSMSDATPVMDDAGNAGDSDMEGEMAMDKPSDESMEPSGPVVLAAGNFDRKDSVHYANGQAVLARDVDGSYILRLQDLDAANGPDLYVYVSEHPNPQTSGELHTGEHNLGTLKATNGSFSYTIDPEIDATRIRSVVIYCKTFDVLFSTAALQAPQ